MNPQLTETWGSGYIQVVVSMLVFVLGVAVILYQFSIPNEIKIIIQKREKPYWFFILIGYIIISSLMLVWILHPCSGISLNVSMNIITGVMVTCVILMSCLFFLLKLKNYSVESLINIIFNEFQRNHKIKNIINENAINDLIYLGMYTTGNENRLVIKKIEQVANLIASKNPYIPHSLDEIIFGIEKIVLDKNKTVNDIEIIAAVNLYKRLINIMDECVHDKDLIIARICNIGIKTIADVFEDKSITIMDVIKEYGQSEWLYKMGLAGIRNKKFNIALNALNSLEGIVELSGTELNQGVYYLIGMISHFWLDGISGQKRAAISLELLKDKFKKQFVNVLDQSQSFFYDTGDFETADKINQFLIKTHIVK